MKAKRIFILFFIFAVISSSFSLASYGEEDTKNITEFSSELEGFITNNSQYYSTIETPDSDNEDEDIINTNRLIVSTNSNNPIENTCGAVNCLEGFNNWHILQYDCEDSTVAAYKYYSSQDYVNYVELDEIIAIKDEESSKSFVNTYSSDSKTLNWGAEKVKSVSAINIIKKAKINSQTVVAVIDSGVDASHSFFTDEPSNTNRILNGNRPKDNAPDPNQSNYSHGTKVAGVIVDNTPSNVKIKPYNYYYYQNGTSITLASEILSAIDDNVDVINLSLGDYTVKSSVEEAVRQAIEDGIVIVASAGNNGEDACNHYPSNYPNVISVAAFNSNDKPWSNSSNGKKTNYGSSIDISAPGSVIKTTVPGGGYETDGGTSMAAPFVSAAVAILKSINKSLSPVRICEILTKSAYKPNGWDKNYASNYGAGIVNFENMLKYVTITAPTIYLSSNDKIFITSSAGKNAKYYYTIDGKTPTVNSTEYKDGFSIPDTAKTIKAIAVVDGMLASEVAEYPLSVYKKISINYKAKKELQLPDDAKNIKYYIADEKIVSIERGQIKGLQTGETDITIKMNANRTYYYHVTVEYAWWQWLIRIFLLGIFWY